ncbi:MAG: hypothetical protein Q7S48_04655 [bacterium]|nr:hypothetical protein [bacterium]
MRTIGNNYFNYMGNVERGEAVPSVEAGVRLALEQLSKEELNAFKSAIENNSISFGGEDLRRDCENKPWFDKVDSLFTDDGGKKLHSDTLKIVKAFVAERWS